MDYFAADFKPTFSASQLSNFTGNPGQKTKINFLVRFEPFIEYSQKLAKSEKKANPVLVTADEKASILSDLRASVSNGKFDDKSLIEKVKKEADLDPLAEKLSSLNFDESIDEKHETAESDEDSSNLKNDEGKLQKIRDAQVNRYVSTNRGKIFESHILARINKEENANFTKNKEKKIFDFGMFRINGIIDGIDLSGRQIIEIKTRKKLNAEKCTITSRERIQALAYIKLFDCESCLFVEYGPDGSMKKELIEWDELKFKAVVDKLEKFTMFARGLRRNEFEEMIDNLS